MRLIDRLGAVIVRRTDPRPVGVVRAVVGGAAFLKALVFAPVLLSVAEPARVAIPVANWVPQPGTAGVWILILAWAGAALAFALGWRTRMNGCLLTGALACVLLLDAQFYSNHLYLLILVCALLTLADAGAAVSLDARMGRGSPEIAAWPVLLLKVQISVVYLFAALAKINLTYLSGGILSASWRWEGSFAMPEILRTPEVLLPIAVISVFMEGFLAFGLWSERWRGDALVVGLLLHGGIVLTMSPVSELLIFGLVSISLYLLFFPPVAVTRPVVLWGEGSRRKELEGMSS